MNTIIWKQVRKNRTRTIYKLSKKGIDWPLGPSLIVSLSGGSPK